MSKVEIISKFRRFWWLVFAGFVALVYLLRRRQQPAIAAELLRKAHEADVDAQFAKRRLDDQAEEEIRQIRRGLSDVLGDIEAKKVDDVAKLEKDSSKLLELYRAQGRELGL